MRDTLGMVDFLSLCILQKTEGGHEEVHPFPNGRYIKEKAYIFHKAIEHVKMQAAIVVTMLRGVHLLQVLFVGDHLQGSGYA
jgi:hypothetical protein